MGSGPVGNDDLWHHQGPVMSGRPCRVARQGDLTRQLDMEEKSRHPLPDMNKELIKRRMRTNSNGTIFFIVLRDPAMVK